MTPRPEVLTVGETMVLVTPSIAEPLESAQGFHLDPGGAESNVAAHLAALGTPVAWASAVGDDALGRRLVRQIADRGVDTALVVRDGDAPTGLYVKDPGNGVRYYRAGSAASRLGPAFVDGLPIADVRLVHVSGITPALSGDCDALVEAILDAAAAAGVAVSFDVNHRPSLWPSTDAAAERLLALAARADIVFVGLDEAQALWGAATPEAVRALLPGVRELVVKDGAVGATSFERAVTDAPGGPDASGGTGAAGGPGGSRVGSDNVVHVPALVVDAVELVGAGDAFAAGHLHALLAGRPAAERLRSGHERAVLTIADTADFPRTDMTTNPTAAPASVSDPSARPGAVVAGDRPLGPVSNAAFDEIFAGRPLMALFRGLGEARSLELARTAWSLGIDLVELPIQSEADVAALAAVAAAGRAEGRLVGAGTVLTARHVELAAEAGAAFTVSPGFDAEVVRASTAAGLPSLPGVATATEVQAALALGLTWMKAFPASLLGVPWFRAMAGPFPQARFVGTGGIDASNARAYLDAGVRTVAVGSALEDPAQLPALAALLAE